MTKRRIEFLPKDQRVHVEGSCLDDPDVDYEDQGNSMVVVFSDEGIICDLVRNGEVVKTSCRLWEDIIGAMHDSPSR